MYGFLIVIHIIVSLILIVAILLQAGHGGGLSDAFGGGGGGLERTFGTGATTFLTRVTAAAAVIFIFTSLSLAVISGNKGKSLIKMENIQDEVTSQERATPPQAGVKVGEEEPVPVPVE